MHLIDSHCHLFMDPLAADVAGVLARAAVREVRQVVVPAYDRPSWAKVGELAGRPDVFAAYGLHPWVAGQVSSAPGGTGDANPLKAADYADRCSRLLPALETVCDGSVPPVAIGEIGLDDKVEVDPGLQRAVLRAQLELAIERDLPVILHCRGAFAALLEEVQRFDGRLRGVLHAYSRGPDPANSFLAAGLCVGFGGAITRDRAKRALKAAANLPLDKILLETDAPSIGLDGVLPEETEPGHVRDVAEALAALRGESVETIAEVTTRNARELFRLPE